VKVLAELNKLTKRTEILSLRAQTFEEERILGCIVKGAKENRFFEITDSSGNRLFSFRFV